MGSGTLMNAPDYNPAKERRRRIIIWLFVAAALGGFVAGWKGPDWFARYRADQIVEQFFSSLQHKDYEGAYGVWIADSGWKQHPDKYPDYTYHQFYLDWGPGGDWGLINKFKIEGSTIPEDRGYKSSTQIVVQVQVNDRIADKAQIWVNRTNKTLTEMPR